MAAIQSAQVAAANGVIVHLDQQNANVRTSQIEILFTLAFEGLLDARPKLRTCAFWSHVWVIILPVHVESTHAT